MEASKFLLLAAVQVKTWPIYQKVKGQEGVCCLPGTKVTWMVLSSCFPAAFSLRMASKYHIPQHFMSCSWNVSSLTLYIPNTTNVIDRGYKPVMLVQRDLHFHSCGQRMAPQTKTPAQWENYKVIPSHPIAPCSLGTRLKAARKHSAWEPPGI